MDFYGLTLIKDDRKNNPTEGYYYRFAILVSHSWSSSSYYFGPDQKKIVQKQLLIKLNLPFFSTFHDSTYCNIRINIDICYFF